VETLKQWLPYGVGAIATLLLVDLFLPWHHVSVSVAGNLVAVEADSSAWADWGAVAGVVLIVLLVWEGVRLFAQRVASTLVTFILAVTAAACTVIEFVTGTVDVTSGSIVVVGVHGRQWPGYVGLVLAALLVVAAVAQLERPEARRRRPELHLGTDLTRNP
jgi:uncharacterized membrane protein YjdF